MLRLLIGLCLAALATGAWAEATARLIFFTEDGSEDAAPLVPGFALHSVWSALGQTPDGKLYVAVSNHDEENGNVFLFALDPGASAFRVIGDVRSVSEAAGNWQDGESQYKVHTFLLQHSDGLIYFATSPANDPEGERGAHLYTLDPVTEEVVDLSATMPWTLNRDNSIVPGTGVLFAGMGVKGIGLNPDYPGVLYAMAHDLGQLVRVDLVTGELQVIARSARVAYVFHVDSQGDVYFLGGAPEEPQTFYRYEAATGALFPLMTGVATEEEIGMISPTANPDVIMVLMSNSKDVFPVHTASERVLRGGDSCGRNRWRLYNMTAGPDGKLYFVSNNNSFSRIWQVPVGGGNCVAISDVDGLLGSRNLAFGGRNIWIGDSFFTPVWTHNGNYDLAILQVTP